MTLTFDDPKPESGKCLHTQESGDAGFSSDRKHIFSENYQDSITGCGLPVINKGSSVRPMFNDELDNYVLTRQEMPQLLAFESEPIVSAGEETTHLRNRKQSSAYPEEQPFQGNVDVGLEEQFKPCHPRRQRAQKIIQRRKRTTDHHSTKIKKKSLIVCCCILAVGLVGVCDASAGTCFTCMDKAKCPNLITIFAENDVLVYERDTAEKIPKCPGAPPITRYCSVCWSQSDINIYCPNNITTLEPEDSNGSIIRNITKGCDQQQKSYPAATGRNNKGSCTRSLTGLICSAVAVLMVL